MKMLEEEDNLALAVTGIRIINYHEPEVQMMQNAHRARNWNLAVPLAKPETLYAMVLPCFAQGQLRTAVMVPKALALEVDECHIDQDCAQHSNGPRCCHGFAFSYCSNVEPDTAC
ncbi:hypothetical protein Agabi119p4_7074 [Agaricus bisporus var. burnettii]|uniref:Uncharacterized protein n=1 Tax=Agaricus bisporus var. burnettii TaxID=192524 RepID=A0A8H7F0R1_AGABI|nr:hypothetical protein Agabi119p4_7074 [Agaricus bisporus var. burnettii]